IGLGLGHGRRLACASRQRPWTAGAIGSLRPVTAVNHLVGLLATAASRRPADTLVGGRVADRDRSDRRPLVRNPELVADGGDLPGRYAEEAWSQLLIDGRQQDEEAGHTGVDMPVRYRPA